MIKRDISAKYINLVGLCVWLVMFGHIMERIPALSTNICGWFVYSVHSALFMTCMGRVAQCNWKWSIPLYILSLLTPMWWIGVTALCMLTIPLLQKVPQRCRWVVFVAALTCGLLSGFCPDPHGIAAKLQLTRFVSFYPYFVFGVYEVAERKSKIAKYCIPIITIVISIIAGVISGWKPLPFLMSMSYAPNSDINTCLWRIVAYVIGFGMVYTAIVLMKSTPAKWIHTAGLTALTVYIAHNYLINIAIGFTRMLGSLISIPIAAGIITTIVIATLTMLFRCGWRVLHKGGAT